MTSVVTWRYVENKINLTFNVGVVLWGGGGYSVHVRVHACVRA